MSTYTHAYTYAYSIPTCVCVPVRVCQQASQGTVAGSSLRCASGPAGDVGEEEDWGLDMFQEEAEGAGAR